MISGVFECVCVVCDKTNVCMKVCRKESNKFCVIFCP